MARLLSTGIYGFLCSAKKAGEEYIEHFLSGFAGYGWKIWEYTVGKWMLEIDSLRVRGTMTVYEMIISKIRAIIGALAISQAQGKIKTVSMSDDGTEYMITIEGDMSFQDKDFIRCQTFTNSEKLYHVEISYIESNSIIHIPVTEFAEYTSIPEVGDEIIQFGNEENTARQSAIYIHADEQDQPAIDVMFGINSKDWTNCVKIRVGGNIPGTDGLKGLYVENGMIKGVNDDGVTTYCIYPNGTAEFGNGSAQFKNDKSGYLAGGAISWEWDVTKNKYVTTLGNVVLTWANLDEDVKEALQPAIGENGNWFVGGVDTGVKAEGMNGTDANLLDWINDWNTNKTLIGDDYVVSPKIFSGTKDGNGKLTGIALGRDCIKINDILRTGIYGLNQGLLKFILDPINGEYRYSGSIATPPVHINKFNYSNYGQMSGGSPTYSFSLDFDLSGFNVQFDNMRIIDDVVGHVNIILPRSIEYEGIEFNIVNGSFGSSIYVNEYAATLNSATGEVSLQSKIVDYFIPLKFKCLVGEPGSVYPTERLIDSKAIEWVLINN